MDDAHVAVPLIPLQVDLLLVAPDDFVGVYLQHIIDDAQEHGDVAKELCGDALAGGVDGNFAPSTGEHERSSKHADTDCFSKPVFFLINYCY